MSRAGLIRTLAAERCNLDEIQAATGCARQYIVERLGLSEYPRRRPGFARGNRRATGTRRAAP